MKRADREIASTTSNPTANLTFRLFSTLEIEAGNRSLDLPASTKSRSLLAYLVLNHSTSHPRDRLIGIFWPERSDERARRSLSNALWQIRRTLDAFADRLVTEGDTVSFTLQSEDRLDVETFEEIIAQLRRPDPISIAHRLRLLHQAASLYRADLLEELYDDWVLLERERLREHYLDVLGEMLVAYKQIDQPQKAVLAAQRLATADPLRESAHRELMRLYHLTGRPQAALDQFDILSRLLEDELGAEPMPRTAALYHEIVAAMEETEAPYLPISAPPPPLLEDLSLLPFVGRRDERKTLIEALKAAAQGQPGVALLEGQAGVGKTRLVKEIIAGAEWRGFQVGIGKLEPTITPAPYQPLREALDPLLNPLRLAQLANLIPLRQLSAVAPLLPVIDEHVPDLPFLPQIGHQAEQERLWDGIGHVLKGLSTPAPLLLVLEDVHWADSATLAALPHVLSSLAGGRVLCILSYRSVEAREHHTVWQALDQLSQNTPPVQVVLSPLAPDTTTQLVQRALAAGEDESQIACFAQRLYQEAGGNTFFLIELLKTLLEYGALSPNPDGTWHLPPQEQPLPTPTSVQELIDSRLARLAPTQREMLQQAAVLGKNMDFVLLSHLDDTPVDQLVDRLGNLCRHSFLIETDTGYRFEHDLVQEAVYRDIDPDNLVKLHRQAGQAIEALHPESTAALAFHFERGNVPEKALHYTRQAGDQALAIHEIETALDHFRRAEAMVEDDPATRWDILADVEKTLDVLSRRDEQRQILDEMLALDDVLEDPVRRAHTLQRYGWCEVLGGSPSDAVPLLEEAVLLAESTGEKDLQGFCLTSIARAWWRMGEMTPCQEAIQKARVIFEETGDREGETQALNMLGNLHLGMTGNYSQALYYFEKMRQINLELERPYHAMSAYGNVGITLSVLGRYRRSQDILEEVHQTMVEMGNRNWQGIIHHWRAVNLRAMGHLDEAHTAAEASLNICREVGNANFEIGALDQLGMIALAQGNPSQACEYFRRAMDIAQAHQQKIDLAVNTSYLALSLLRRGEAEEALHLSQVALSAGETQGWMPNRLKDIYFNCYQVALELEGVAAAQPLLERSYQCLVDIASKIKDPAMRTSFVEDVPENQSIATAHRLGRVPSPPRQETVSLSAASAPTGRPLQEDELVEVTWTLVAPEDSTIEGKVARRRYRLLRLLREAKVQSAAPTTADLADALGVSQRTIQRDLTALRAVGHTIQTRGSR